MISMKPSDGFVPNFTSLDFELDRPARMVLAVIGLTAGTITFQYSVDLGVTWHVLDADNLVFTADGTRAMVWGATQFRCVGDGNIAGADLDVLIEGPNIIRT